MDTKRLIVTMLVSMAVIFGWQYMVARWYQQHPEALKHETPATTTPSGVGASAPTTGIATTGIAIPTTATAPQIAQNPVMSAGAFGVRTSTTGPADVTLGRSDNYPLQVVISSRGAGLDQITLKKHKAPGGQGPYIFQQPYQDESSPAARALSTRTIIVNKTAVDVSGPVWTLANSGDRSAEWIVELVDANGKPAVRVHKTYGLSEASAPGKGYELTVNHAVENLSGQPINVSIAFDGANTPPRETERGPDLQLITGYDNDRDVYVAGHVLESFDAKTPSRDLTRSEKTNLPLLWGGASSVYFDAIVQPLSLDEKSAIPKYIDKVTAFALNPDSDPHDRHVAMTFETKELPVAANATLKLPATVFLGPKQRTLFKGYYSQYPRSYHSTLVITSGWCAVCTFQPIIDALVWLLVAFHTVLRDWGLAIIALVVLVRTLLHPITKRSQVSMMKMGKMGPDMERLKQKYGDDKDELNKQMMTLYKEQGFTPILGCLPMFLQMPIWIALWSSLQSTFELRQAPFLWGFTWIHDLARPDRLIEFTNVQIPTSIPLFGGTHISGINLLPVLLAVVFYLQQKMTPKPPATTKEQEQQQKMMQWMSLLFPIFLYNGPSGLNLYILTSTTIGIIEAKIIRNHIKQREEAEKAGKVIVDAGPTRGMKRKKGDEGLGGVGAKREPPKPTGWFGKLIADMQVKAAELRKQADRGGK